MIVRMSGYIKIPSRVAPQELMMITLVPAIFIVWDKGIFLCHSIQKAADGKLFAGENTLSLL